MTRVCLECGTPKFAYRRTCSPCAQKTREYEGPERRSLCEDCRHWRGTCDLIRDDILIARLVKHSNVFSKIVRHTYNCDVFESKSYRHKPSPHPLSLQEKKEIEMFLDNSLAFWLDPKRWDHVGDERKDMFWKK